MYTYGTTSFFYSLFLLSRYFDCEFEFSISCRKDNISCFEYLNTQSLIAVMLEWPAWFNWVTKELGWEILSVMVTLKSWVLTLRDMSRNSFYITSRLWQRVSFIVLQTLQSLSKRRETSLMVLSCIVIVSLCCVWRDFVKNYCATFSTTTTTSTKENEMGESILLPTS